MAKSYKKKNKKQEIKQVEKKEIDFSLNLTVNNLQLNIAYAAVCLLSLALAIYYIIFAKSLNGFFSFPLDDPWIHLTFAKNLVEYHSFSYFKNEMVTAGSTSPLYTIILAVFFSFIKNEMILSYILGIVFLIISSYFFFRIAIIDFSKEFILAAFAIILFITDRWMSFIAVSGMETTMFIALLLLTLYFYKQRKMIPFAIFFSLIIWCRPDGLVFMLAIAIDYLYNIYLSKSNNDIKLFDKKELIRGGIIAGIILIIYFIFNYILSGSLLPNTYNAKISYYTTDDRRPGFIKNEVWNYFTEGYYGIIMAGFFLSIIFTIKNSFLKKYDSRFLYIIFVLGFILTYYIKLPYAHRFGRYLMPVIPFFILVSIIGIRDTMKLIAKLMNIRSIYTGITVIILSILIFFSTKSYLENKNEYAMESAHIKVRQVDAALWLRDNTNENDIIATHDVGAIGFYSNRKIVDIAGLVTPELITKINDLDYVNYMQEYLKNSNVTYLAILREWYRVVNQNPVFSTASISPIEIMEIYKYEPGKTHILSKLVNSGMNEVINRFGTRNMKEVQYGMQILNQTLQYESNSSLTYFLLGSGAMLSNDAVNAEKYLLKSIEIFPEYKDAIYQLAVLYRIKGRIPDAVKYYEMYLKLFPDDKKIQEEYNNLAKSLMK